MIIRRCALMAASVLTVALVWPGAARAGEPTAKPKSGDAETKQPDKQSDLKPIDLELPKPAFKGTPKHVPPGTRLEKPRSKPREPFLAPPGTKNVAKGKPVTSSDMEPIIGALELVTDGDKEARAGTYVELGPGLQYVQIDLEAEFALHALVVWHYHATARVYHDVIVQVSDDADFISGVKTIYNNDHDNSAGMGVGEQLGYWETYEGLLIDAKGVKARYVRLYSGGSIEDDLNHYIEVEVYGTPAS